MEQEGASLGALLGVAAYEVSGDTLILRDGAGAVVLTYVLQAQTPLEGTTWIAEAYNNGRGGVVSVLGGTQLTALFDGGRLTGSAGCNSYMTSYTASGSAIEIGLAATTRLFCATPDGVMEQEAAYLAALPTAAAYRIDGNRMILERADGARVASFTPMDGGLAPETPITGSGKITFDLASIDEAGLTGPPDGQVAVAYEFCIPATTDRLTEVQSIDPTVQAQGGAPGRIGCGPDELLCIGSTHQANWRSVLEKLATLDYVSRIDRSFAE
jgi:heat shock protein HslJ